LVRKNAQFEVEQAAFESSKEGMQQISEDFMLLTNADINEIDEDTNIDLTRTDIKKYLTEYSVYYQKYHTSRIRKNNLEYEIENIKNTLKNKQDIRDRLLKYKQ
jgi:hypothetical protein